MHKKLDDDMIALLADCVYAVEATRFEQMCLWQKYTGEGYVWKENLSGRGATVGYLNDMPVAISLNTAVVNGNKILFYNATSVVVDWGMIEEWLQKNMPSDTKKHEGSLRKTDASNFHDAVWFTGVE